MKMRGFVENIPMLVATVLFVLIFVAVVPTVGTTAFSVTNGTGTNLLGGNVTGASNALTGLVPLIFVAIGIVALVGMFRGAG